MTAADPVHTDPGERYFTDTYIRNGANHEIRLSRLFGRKTVGCDVGPRAGIDDRGMLGL